MARDFPTQHSLPFIMSENGPDTLKDPWSNSKPLLCVVFKISYGVSEESKALSLSLAFSVKNCLFSSPFPIFFFFLLAFSLAGQ